MNSKKIILVLDGQGGGMGTQLIKMLAPVLPGDCELVAVGTNVLATNAMLKAGARRGATGENAVVYNASRADIILGPIGMILANGIMGEVSPRMASAVSGSEAEKILIPSSHCGVQIAGTQDCRLEEYLERRRHPRPAHPGRMSAALFAAAAPVLAAARALQQDPRPRSAGHRRPLRQRQIHPGRLAGPGTGLPGGAYGRLLPALRPAPPRLDEPSRRQYGLRPAARRSAGPAALRPYRPLPRLCLSPGYF